MGPILSVFACFLCFLTVDGHFQEKLADDEEEERGGEPSLVPPKAKKELIHDTNGFHIVFQVGFLVVFR